MTSAKVSRPPARAPLVKLITTALDDMKAVNVKVLDVRKLTSLYDTLVIATADSNRQVNALARNVRDKLKEALTPCPLPLTRERGSWR